LNKRGLAHFHASLGDLEGVFARNAASGVHGIPPLVYMTCLAASIQVATTQSEDVYNLKGAEPKANPREDPVHEETKTREAQLAVARDTAASATVGKSSTKRVNDEERRLAREADLVTWIYPIREEISKTSGLQFEHPHETPDIALYSSDALLPVIFETNATIELNQSSFSQCIVPRPAHLQANLRLAALQDKPMSMVSSFTIRTTLTANVLTSSMSESSMMRSAIVPITGMLPESGSDASEGLKLPMGFIYHFRGERQMRQ
jgi:hypothetical protein